jgi:hypothetical protein
MFRLISTLLPRQQHCAPEALSLDSGAAWTAVFPEEGRKVGDHDDSSAILLVW